MIQTVIAQWYKAHVSSLLVVRSSLVISSSFLRICLNTAYTYISYSTISLIVFSMLLCVVLFRISKQILTSFRLYGVQWLVWRLCFSSNNILSWIPRISIYKSVCTPKQKNKKRKWGNSLPNTGLEPTTSIITGRCPNHCAADATLTEPFITLYIYSILIIVSWTDTSEVWIEYLNERFKVWTFDNNIGQHSMCIYVNHSSFEPKYNNTLQS